MTFRPTGILVPLVTPFTDGGAGLATADLRRLAHDVIDEGAAGIVALGTTAEPATLSPRERADVLRICGEVCRERGVPLIAGAGSNDTAATVRDIRELSAGTAAAALVVVPYYTRPSEAGVVAHFEHVAERSPLPLVLYNVPYRTGQQLSWESIVRLAAHPRIVGIKQAVGSVDADTARLLAEPTESFAVLAGEDVLASPLLAMGAAGAIVASANVLTREFVELFEAWRTGTPAAARALGNRLVGPACALFSEPNPVAIKAVLHAQGRISSASVRLPLLPAADPAPIVGALQRLRDYSVPVV